VRSCLSRWSACREVCSEVNEEEKRSVCPEANADNSSAAIVPHASFERARSSLFQVFSTDDLLLIRQAVQQMNAQNHHQQANGDNDE
jgi:hypothetical protein